MARHIKLGAVDDHPLILTGLRAELAQLAPDISLVEAAASVQQLLSNGAAADVVLLDLRLRDGSSPASNVVELREAGCRVIVYTEGGTRRQIDEALAAGAEGVLNKDRDPAVLIEAIRSLASGETFESEEVARALDRVPALRPSLSPREQETLMLYASGLPTKLVARQLDVGIETVREYLKRIRAKYTALNRAAGTRMEMYQRAVEDGVVNPMTGE